MALVGVLPSAEDEVNAATWHPFEVGDFASILAADVCVRITMMSVSVSKDTLLSLQSVSEAARQVWRAYQLFNMRVPFWSCMHGVARLARVTRSCGLP